MSKLTKFYLSLESVIITLLIKAIEFYQKTVSPDHGFFKIFYPLGYCRFRPTCSDYAKDALRKHGLIKGLVKAMWRILRCNPWNKGGHDPA